MKIYKKKPGFTLIEMLVAVFLAVNMLAGMIMAYASVIRYLQRARQQVSGEANVSMAMTMIEKELSNVNRMSTDPNEVIYSPDTEVNRNNATTVLIGAVDANADGDMNDAVDRCFMIYHEDDSVKYCAETNCEVGSSCSSSVITIATKIPNLAFLRRSNNTIYINITAEMKKDPKTGVTITQDFEKSIAIAYSN